MAFSSRNPTRHRLWLCGLGLTLAIVGCAHLTGSDTPLPVVADPSPAEPVTAAMATNEPAVHPGATFQLVVRVRIAPGYHIYSTTQPQGPFSPTSITFVLPKELEALGDWIAPTPILTKTGESVYRDSVLFRRQVRVRLNAPESLLSIKGGLLCQACAQDLCFPARKIQLSASVAVVSITRK